ncbi:LuxR C-terminal-related transcriptional regulator [Nitratidesulfovibrio sp. D1]|uniref:helix-turn-helix transcriptional regulator n=1 Tax=Nitratidesulfovibrio sp. D1 TaxID=3440151 RepID=UPI003EBD8A2D
MAVRTPRTSIAAPAIPETGRTTEAGRSPGPGTSALFAAARPVLLGIEGQMDLFLARWSEHMREAGYLRHTTAKRQDCIDSLLGFLHPLRAALHAGLAPSFGDLVREIENGATTGAPHGWGHELLASARRHRMRGVTEAMFLGCFHTLIHAVLDVVEVMSAPRRARDAAVEVVRLYGDAFSVLFTRHWETRRAEVDTSQLDEANRLLTLEKCKVENFLNSTSDMVLAIDASGIITSVNRAARQHLAGRAVPGLPIWAALGLEGESMQDLLRFYPLGVSCEITPAAPVDVVPADMTLPAAAPGQPEVGPPHAAQVFRMRISPLNAVSLASDGYLVMLTDVTSHVHQREALERVVAERTEALREEKTHLEEMNITLRTVLRNIDGERAEINREVARKVHAMLLPALDHLEADMEPEVRRGYLTVIRDQLMRLAPDDAGPDPLLLRLSPAEMRICQFIQAGSPTKEIASALNLSVETVQTHRKNIRRKLGLHGKDASLCAFLRSAPGPRSAPPGE